MGGVVLVWIGLMGLAATAVSFLMLRSFPRAFGESSRAADWPWQKSASNAARTRGALLAGAGTAALLVVFSGIIRLLLVH